MNQMNHPETSIDSLGPPQFPSPIKNPFFYMDDQKILLDVDEQQILHYIQNKQTIPTLEKAGPRKSLFFSPSKTRVAIVTCGGLCPGINNVIRSLVMQLFYNYGVSHILGVRYGYQGFDPNHRFQPILLTPDSVRNILYFGGSFLSSSRGAYPTSKIVERLVQMNIQILFVIGGDGTLRGALDIVFQIQQRKLKISVIGIPKTIDNDLAYVSKTFGFETAFSEATRSIRSAHAESVGSPNCIGLIQLMGRHSGFIAAYASLALKEVNFVLVPEVDFDLNGQSGFLNALKKRLENKYHAVIIVAEGAGQKFFQNQNFGQDPSGNSKLGDIGSLLKKKIVNFFETLQIHINLKYINPSYSIRSIPANATDSAFCGFLAQNAVHAAMAGKTNMIVGFLNDHFVHVPIRLVISERKQINPRGKLWNSVLESTGQPCFLNHS